MLLPILLSVSAYASPLPQTGGTAASSTANDVTNDVACRELTVIFARGTSEPGNIGSVVGPPLLSALQSKLGANNVAFQGVPYAASAEVNFKPLKAARKRKRGV